MTVFRKFRLNAVFLGISALLMGSGAAAFDPITIVDQQSFAAGGKVETAPGTFEANRPTEAGQSIHGDHAYFFCQKPADAKPLAMTFLHGAMQFSKTWETTPDGREGFQTIFLRKGWQTCVVDQPRRGNAGRALADAEIKPPRMIRHFSVCFVLDSGPSSMTALLSSRMPPCLISFSAR